MNKFYLVLSVKEINRLARTAKASQKARGSKTSHCVVLDLYSAEAAPEGDSGQQLSSCSFASSVNAIEEATAQRKLIS